MRLTVNGVTTTFDTKAVRTIDADLAAGDDVFVSSLDLPVTVTTGDGDDRVTTGDGDAAVYGGRGDDTVRTGAGADYVDPGGGDNVVDVGIDGSDDYVVVRNSTSAAAAEIGPIGRQVITGGIEGRHGRLHVEIEQAESLDVTFTGDSASVDGMYNTAGDVVRLNVRLGAEVYGGSGDDTLITGRGSDTLYGGGGRDLIESGSGDDSLFGYLGRDTLRGGPGHDTGDIDATDTRDSIEAETRPFEPY